MLNRRSACITAVFLFLPSLHGEDISGDGLRIFGRPKTASHMNEKQACDIALLHLAKKENKEKDFLFYDLLNELGIEKQFHKPVLQALFSPGYIYGLLLLENPMYISLKRD